MSLVKSFAKRRWSARWSLRSYLLVLTLGALVPVLLFSVTVVTGLAEREEVMIRTAMTESARLLTAAIDQELLGSIMTLEALATSEHLDTGDLAAFYRQASRAAAGHRGAWVTVLLALPSGEQLLNLAQPFGLPLPPRAHLEAHERALRTRRPQISDMFVASVPQMPVLSLDVPVVRDGEIRYVLAASLAVGTVGRVLDSAPRVQEALQAVATVYDSNGTVIGRSREADRWLGHLGPPELIDAAEESGAAWVAVELPKGGAIRAAVHRSTLSGWRVAMHAPAEAVTAWLQRSLASTVVGGLVLLGAAIVLATFGARRLAAPIADLAAGAGRMGEGVVIPHRASRIVEIDALAAAVARGSAELYRGHARFHAVMQNMPSGVLILESPSGRWVFANASAERTIGVPEGEGHRWLKRVIGRALGGDETIVDANVEWPRHFAGGDRSGSGRATMLRLSATPVRDEDGRAMYVVVTFHDVTAEFQAARERAERLEREQHARAEAEATNRAKDEFLAMLGHELRNPLAAITSALAVLERVPASDQRTPKFRAMIGRQVGHLSRLVDDLLDVARVTTGKIALDVQPVDVADVVRRAVSAVQARAEAHERGLRLELEPLMVHGDPTRLEQVAVNLLSNAVTYTSPGDTIAVTLEGKGDQAILSVADTGAGIPAELVPRVFEPFVQGPRTIDRAQGGLGIGLTLVRRLVELHDGTVEVESKGAGHGAVFRVRLPLGAVVPRTPGEEAHAVRPCRILLVEDNVDARDSLATWLELAGHTVQSASDGYAAVEAALSNTFDLALVDLGLPGIDGYEVVSRIRSRLDLPVVAVTGYGQPEDRRRSAEAGFVAHLVKPVAPSALDVVLARISGAEAPGDRSG